MTNIICLIEAIYRKQIRCNYLKNKKHFLNFFFVFLKSIVNFKHFPKKMTLIADVFPEMLGPRNILR